MATKKRLPVIQVRAKVDHTQPGSHFYRVTGEKFSHQGEAYEHVELVKDAPPEEIESEDDGGEGTE